MPPATAPSLKDATHIAAVAAAGDSLEVCLTSASFVLRACGYDFQPVPGSNRRLHRRGPDPWQSPYECCRRSGASNQKATLRPIE